MTFAAGTEPRYRIVETIGRGGMGEVCLADDVMLHRQVALKFLATPGESGGLEQLLGEARAAAALDHPFICSIYEVTALDGRHCIAMEYVRGESLERRLRRGPLRVGDALRVAEEIAEALDAAHRRRVIHRDLKPANVMLTEDGHIKVMDFGLAARLPLTDVSDQTVDLSPAPALVRGTPAYMAPEQFRGEPADRRSDIFAFGVLLYEVLSGANPFRRVGIDATIAAVLGEPATQLRDVPPALEALLARLLAKDPAARHQSFTVVRNALRRCSVETTPSATLPPPAVDRAPGEGRARLTGRDSELTQLLNCLRQGRSGSGSLVFLFGEAGIGKTRLAEEALSAARQLGYQTLVGRCYEQDDRPVLMREARVLFIDDGPGKPEAINHFIGRRPIFAFGNSDGDQQMLEYTAAGGGARFMGLVHHTDAEREWAYDRHSSVGRLDKALDEANRRGWTVVDMKRDWRTVFPPATAAGTRALQ